MITAANIFVGFTLAGNEAGNLVLRITKMPGAPMLRHRARMALIGRINGAALPGIEALDEAGDITIKVDGWKFER